MNAGRVELVGLGLEKLVLEPNIGLRARGAPVVEATQRACRRGPDEGWRTWTGT